VDPNGDVFICCYYQNREKSHKIGNALSEDLKDIWFSKKHWLMLDKIDCSICNLYDCRWHEYNYEMNKYLTKINTHHMFC